MNRTLLDNAYKMAQIYGPEANDRAIPNGYDGLKPVHRALVHSFKDLGLKSTGNFKKAARVIGDCFVAGTKVLTPKGEVNIEDLTIGDIVITTKGEQKITEIFFLYEKELLKVIVGNNYNICTKGQKFKVFENNTFIWKRADELKIGDKILCKKGIN